MESIIRSEFGCKSLEFPRIMDRGKVDIIYSVLRLFSSQLEDKEDRPSSRAPILGEFCKTLAENCLECLNK